VRLGQRRINAYYDKFFEVKNKLKN